MRRQIALIAMSVAIAIGATLGGLTLPIDSASAQEAAGAPAAGAQIVLPPLDWRFPGFVGRTMQDSDPPQYPQLTRPPEGAPNIVLIMLDDVGFGQFSVFGGGVTSPNMEKLAAEGLRYNRFHTTALCSPTRAALLTGRNEHTANFGVISEIAIGYDGYTAMMPRSTGTVAEVLRQHGYATAWIGKNHNTPPWETSERGPFDRWPMGMGFDYFYGFNAGDTSQLLPALFEGTKPVPRSSDPNYQTSTDFADHAIAWINKIEAIDPGRPYFIYIAPSATHAAHQPPPDWLDRCKGRFDAGWDAYREATFERQKQLGVIPASAKLTKRPDSLPAWDSLNADQKRLYARMMELFCAYGEHADQEMGRVIDAVHSLPDADNTLIIYIIGDNGSSAEGGLDGSANEVAWFNGFSEKWQDLIKIIDDLGGPKYFNHFPAGWAHAMDTPFQWTKQVASHFGGTRNPMIISWPARIKDKGGLRSQFHHVADIMPTILEAVGVPAPTMLNGVPQQPLEGISMAYTFDDAKAKDRRRVQVFEMVINRGVYEDGWFASSLASVPWATGLRNPDIDKLKWELYNIDEDFSQADDLAAEHPEKLNALQELWWAEAQKATILPLSPAGPDRFNSELMGRPSYADGRKTFVYTEPLPFVPEADAPNLKNKSFSVAAEVEIPAGGGEGMLFTQGGSTAGWGFYLPHGKLVGVHNYLTVEWYRVASPDPIPAGKATLGLDFAYDGKQGEFGKGGTIALTVNGKKVAEGKAAKTVPFLYGTFEGQDVGLDSATPVDFDYTPPFPFNGKIEKVTVELK